jgi:DNA-directed RNA polymerase subunit RPC12/RpoP
MTEKPLELWQVPLHWLRDRGRIESVGIKCNGCGHKDSWPIGEMMQEHGPRTLVSDLWKRWRCAKCGSRQVLPFSIKQRDDAPPQC